VQGCLIVHDGAIRNDDIRQAIGGA